MRLEATCLGGFDYAVEGLGETRERRAAHRFNAGAFDGCSNGNGSGRAIISG